MSKTAPLTLGKRTTKVKGKDYSYWTVYLGTVDGKPKTKQFKSKKVAEDFIKLEKEKQKVLSRKVGADANRLDNHVLRDALSALNLLQGKVTLTEAAKYFIDHMQSITCDKSVEDIYHELLEHRKDKGAKENTTIRDIKKLLALFLKTHGKKKIVEIKTDDLKEWLKKNSNTVRMKHKYRTQLSGLFTYAYDNEYIPVNPVSRIPIPKLTKQGRVDILSVSEAKKLMETAETENSEIVPYFALCLFAGIRPGYPEGEMGRLDWSDIDFKLKEIYIRPAVAKRDIQDRAIHMSDNLIAWLLPYKEDQGGIYYNEYWRRRIIKESTVGWANSIMRHSFGSYHLGMHKNSGNTSEQMGHQGDKMLFRHYRRALSKSEDTNPEAFWGIMPEMT